MRVNQLTNYPINSISIRDMDLIVCFTPTNAMVRYILVYVLTPFLSEVRNFPTLEMGVAQKTTSSTPESLKKIFGVSGDLMEYNERGKPLKRLSSLTNPKSAALEEFTVRLYRKNETNNYSPEYMYNVHCIELGY